MRENIRRNVFAVLIAILLLFAVTGIPYFVLRANYPRPHYKTVSESGLPDSLVYAVIKAESDFDEAAISKAGAIGLMQLMPATAEFICSREKIVFEKERLKEASYNIKLGCKYLSYLCERFPAVETALCAYNAGEGTARTWLKDPELSPDGIRLSEIPYSETRAYLKKILKYRKIYENLYR